MALRITPSERQALQLLANGDTTKDVAVGLRLDPADAEVLLTRLFTALGATTQVEAIAAARKRGLVTLGYDAARTHGAPDQFPDRRGHRPHAS